jgi:hypothetical protein
LDPEAVFELPDDAPMTYRVSGAYPDAPAPMARLEAGKTVDIALGPFQVIVLEAQAEGP